MKKMTRALILTLIFCLALPCAFAERTDDPLRRIYKAWQYLGAAPCVVWGEEINLERNEKVPVYTYPGEEGWRWEKGKAQADLSQPIVPLALSEDGEWLMIEYPVSKGGSRVGYIRRIEDERLAVYPLAALHIPMRLISDFPVNDDPFSMQRTMTSLKRNTWVDVLGYVEKAWSNERPAYAYVEVAIDGKPARGFLPLSVLEPAKETERPDVAAQLAGTWRFTGGGELLGDGIILDGQGRLRVCAAGDTEVFPPEALVIPTDGAICDYVVYENGLKDRLYPNADFILEVWHDDRAVERFALMLGTSQREGSGGAEEMSLFQNNGEGASYERADLIPVTRGTVPPEE